MTRSAARRAHAAGLQSTEALDLLGRLCRWISAGRDCDATRHRIAMRGRRHRRADVRTMSAAQYQRYKAALLRRLSHVPPRAPTLRLLAGAPADPAAYARRFRAELRMAACLLASLVRRLDVWMRRPAGPRAERAWRREIAVRWNRTLRRRGWRTLPTFCETCGRPIFRRHPENAKGGLFVIPTVCSETCRLTRKRARLPRRRCPATD